MKTYMIVQNGVTWKMYRARIVDELPVINRKQKVWFVYHLVDGEWQYIGFFDTKREVEEFIANTRGD